MILEVGNSFEVERTFTHEDVKNFIRVSGDENSCHVIPDEKGRVVVHGLLTGTLPTIIGGRYNVIGRTCNFEFLKPVYTGDTIKCRVEIVKLERQEIRTKATAEFQCHNQNGEPVLSGGFFGFIYDN